ncbi:flavin reductase family protein [Paenibacillus sp. BJ-4]|uniref:flavin reductase family protein n=1 Tax=Paenibacillus sp. BJ-4 TaxID=2878097 RepID=UPI001CF08F58|nr:flavin reductase family protein [Paenibacillus sp. BJ-4]
MRTLIADPVIHAYPGMVAVVTSCHNGMKNVMASGWHTYIGSSPGMYGISLRKETYSHGLIEKSGGFGVQFLPAHRSELIQAVGTFSGRDIDKFQHFEIAYEDGVTVDVPILLDAYLAYECKVVDIHTFGDHDWIVGEIKQAYRDDELFLDEGTPEFSKLHIPLYVGRSTYLVADNTLQKKVHPFYLDK